MIAVAGEADTESVEVPLYLTETYWWAYVHPKALGIFDRPWLINTILWGNYARLRDAALDALGDPIDGRTLQVGCVYGDLTARLADRVAPGASLDVADVLSVQLEHLRAKLSKGAPVYPRLTNSAALNATDASYDRSLCFFLLHEQPEEVRRATLREALRVTRPGGRIVLLDYHRPHCKRRSKNPSLKRPDCPVAPE
ncbi:MAG: class I SAM-dependent methyltransferase [Alphaproteobacteria bacterium]|nr:class I SAM-dependent methyltransferase [Alphaproteobacteria bacterium]